MRPEPSENGDDASHLGDFTASRLVLSPAEVVGERQSAWRGTDSCRAVHWLPRIGPIARQLGGRQQRREHNDAYVILQACDAWVVASQVVLADYVQGYGGTAKKVTDTVGGVTGYRGELTEFG